MKKYLSFILLLIAFPHPAYAILPPDIIFSVGSQLSQIISLVGVFIAGGLFTFSSFFRGFFVKFYNTKKIILFIAFALILSVFLSIYFFILKNPVQISPPIFTTNGNATSTYAEGYRFFSDEFVIAGKTTDGEPLLIELILNRKEIAKGKYLHYYFANLVSGANGTTFYNQAESEGTQILTDLFISRYEKEDAVDHSTRANFVFTFTLGGKSYDVVSSELTGDFIIKDKPEYTSSISAGKSKVTVDGKVFDTTMMHQESYSTDYRKSIFFAGSDKLKSEATQLVLWDDVGTFYLIDQSNVEKFSPVYSSHIWGLMKDSGGNLKKTFSGFVRKETTPSATKFFASIPDFHDSSIVVTLKTPYDENQAIGMVEGEVKDARGVRRVYGQGSYNSYGQIDE